MRDNESGEYPSIRNNLRTLLRCAGVLKIGIEHYSMGVGYVTRKKGNARRYERREAYDLREQYAMPYFSRARPKPRGRFGGDAGSC